MPDKTAGEIPVVLSGFFTEVYIELDEFQVQMAIDEFKKMKYTFDRDNSVAYEESCTNVRLRRVIIKKCTRWVHFY